jgi:hypothetical protein
VFGDNRYYFRKPFTGVIPPLMRRYRESGSIAQVLFVFRDQRGERGVGVGLAPEGRDMP